jgi:localization factor PodJL
VFHQLEEAIAAMRHVGSHVASDGALAQLAAEVHGLAARFEHATQESSSNEALHRLESRISALMESGRAVPPDLEESMRSLSERLDRMQLSQGDQLALGSLEDRIVKLVERLDACDARLSGLDAIERGIADVLLQLEEMRKSNARGPRAAAAVLPEPPPPAPEPLPIAPIPPAPQLHAPPIAAAPAAPQIEIMEPPPAVSPPPPKPAPQAAQRRPIDPNLPPDTPLEPGSGVPRSKPGSPAARIAASEAALSGVRPAMSESGGKSAAIAAARSAAMTYQADAPQEKRKSLLSWFKSRKPKLPKPPKAPKPQKLQAASDPDAPRPTLRQQVFKHLKTLVIAVSIVIIVLGTLQTAMDFFMAPQPAETQPAPAESKAPAPAEAPVTAPATTPGRTMPTPNGPPPAGPSTEPSTEPGTTGAIGRTSSMFDPTTVLSPKQPPASADVTGSIARQPPAQGLAPTGDPTVDALPAPFGPQLRAAAANRDHSAEYEIAMRYAEGRGVARNMDEAVRWLERAANAGFVPAQFRLAGVQEKGEGVKKNLNAARKLYLAAAEKGHAKAMHNLAVLYAEGIDGKPDYRIAAQWFRRAAAHGVADSQFNLAILYARGIGIEPNLAESYKWFALAAGTGDQDAARKRDEVAGRLDPQTLMAARLAAQTFTPEREPEEAASVKAPPGGWDRATAVAQPAKPRARPRTTAQP